MSGMPGSCHQHRWIIGQRIKFPPSGTKVGISKYEPAGSDILESEQNPHLLHPESVYANSKNSIKLLLRS